MTEAPRSERLHIGIFGNRNAGKSSLINALTGQNVSVVSDVAGTTTDPVYKAMELHGFGPVVFIDTPGLDDTGELGELRVKKTMEALEKTDVAVFVFEPSALYSKSGVSPTVAKVTEEWLARIKAKNIPIIPVVNKCDDLLHSADSGTYASCDGSCDISISGGEMPADLGTPLPVSAKNGTNIEKLRELIIKFAPESFLETSITGNLVQNGDLVLLVMPQEKFVD